MTFSTKKTTRNMALSILHSRIKVIKDYYLKYDEQEH